MSVSEFRYSIFDTMFIYEYLNYIFISISNHILSCIVGTIRIQIQIPPKLVHGIDKRRHLPISFLYSFYILPPSTKESISKVVLSQNF